MKKLSMNKSKRFFVYEVCVTLVSSTMLLSCLFQEMLVFSMQRFLNVQKSLGCHTENSNFAVIEGNQMPFGIFICE